jgi:hypothetical protein
MPVAITALYLFLAITTAWVAWCIRINRVIEGAEGLERALRGLPTRVERVFLTLLVRAGLATLAAVWAFKAVMTAVALLAR